MQLNYSTIRKIYYLNSSLHKEAILFRTIFATCISIFISLVFISKREIRLFFIMFLFYILIDILIIKFLIVFKPIYRKESIKLTTISPIKKSVYLVYLVIILILTFRSTYNHKHHLFNFKTNIISIGNLFCK